MSSLNRQVCLKSRPVARVEANNFELVETALPELLDGQIRVRVVYSSLDPAMRGWLRDAKSYIEPVAIGAVMRALGVGVVIDSKHADFAVGDHVNDAARGVLGWQEIATVSGDDVARIPKDLPLQAAISVLGMTGMTAYFGLLDIGQPKAGETVVVSAANGAVGALVGQIAKINGCRVVGIAGSDEKCRRVVDELGFDAAVNYKDDDFAHKLRTACPDRIDVYFENVGGMVLDTVLAQINVGARISFCGAISTYNATEPVAGPYNFRSLLVNRARVEGFIVFDFIDRFAEAIAQMGEWLKDGKLSYQVHVVDGLENAPDALNMLFDGANLGKLVVKVSEEP